jgi:hypothetical protein
MGFNISYYPEWFPASSRDRIEALCTIKLATLETHVTETLGRLKDALRRRDSPGCAGDRPHPRASELSGITDDEPIAYISFETTFITIFEGFVTEVFQEFWCEVHRLAFLGQLDAVRSIYISEETQGFLDGLIEPLFMEYFPNAEHLDQNVIDRLKARLFSRVNETIEFTIGPDELSRALRAVQRVRAGSRDGYWGYSRQENRVATNPTDEDATRELIGPVQGLLDRVKELHSRVRGKRLTKHMLALLVGSNETDIYYAMRADSRRGKSARAKLPAALTQLERELLAEEKASNIPNMFPTSSTVSIAEPKRNPLNTSCEQQSPSRTTQNQRSATLTKAAG